MTTALPPVTDAHRRAAFARLALVGWSYDAALRDPIRARVIEALAHRLRTAEWQASHRRAVRVVRRYDPASGRWCSQRLLGQYDPDQPTLNASTP